MSNCKHEYKNLKKPEWRTYRIRSMIVTAILLYGGIPFVTIYVKEICNFFGIGAEKFHFNFILYNFTLIFFIRHMTWKIFDYKTIKYKEAYFEASKKKVWKNIKKHIDENS